MVRGTFKASAPRLPGMFGRIAGTSAALNAKTGA